MRFRVTQNVNTHIETFFKNLITQTEKNSEKKLSQKIKSINKFHGLP